ncbi:agamous-like MADS-box protein AGL29 isoform X2 [Prosopis cineraria]|uniref:agamous-like MADS-box protein AGL29 isoform X2 n=1 Tax=Prosopis cineraria TaxID=364024 RepID=UPI00240EDD8A|nr:agamous-like MADS-box protein AGL29 isoform X2 [Prosopis cineraria]
MARRPSKKNKTLIQDARIKHVTFSKRRFGIFKKASELCTLCAVEMVLIIFSPGGKPYSFSHPSSEAVINRLVTGSADPKIDHEERAEREARLAELNKHCCDLNAQLKEEKKRGKELKKRMMNLPDIEKMNREELMKMKTSLEDLRVRVRNRKEELLAGKAMEDDDDLSLTLGGVFSAGEASSSSANKGGGDINLSLSAFVPR